jgi:hypothetical protein
VHKGRVVKRTGDGSIIAVRCAIEVQIGTSEHNAGNSGDRRALYTPGSNV